MRLIFDDTGALREFHETTPDTAGPAAPWVTVDVEYPSYFVRASHRAADAGRITYVGGRVCLDGATFVAPTIRSEVSYPVALNAIATATTVAQLREILYRVADELLGLGALEL